MIPRKTDTARYRKGQTSRCPHTDSVTTMWFVGPPTREYCALITQEAEWGYVEYNFDYFSFADGEASNVFAWLRGSVGAVWPMRDASYTQLKKED